MMSASHVAESLRDSEEPQLRCGVSLGEADLLVAFSEKCRLFDGTLVVFNYPLTSFQAF